MSVLETEAIVLHSFDYLETSRIIRLLTREAGIQSVLARGARRSRARYGSALDLFAGGTAQLHLRPGRDLQTLASMEVTHSRAGLAADIGRFTGASTVAELVLRFISEESESGSAIFDIVTSALDEIESASEEDTLEATLAGIWSIVGTLGLTPALDVCASCHAPLADDADAAFSHPAGGALCERCSRSIPRSRTLPAPARRSLREWVNGRRVRTLSAADGRAHQRLLREFVQEHLGDHRPLRAYAVWEHAGWGSP